MEGLRIIAAGELANLIRGQLMGITGETLAGEETFGEERRRSVFMGHDGFLVCCE